MSRTGIPTPALSASEGARENHRPSQRDFMKNRRTRPLIYAGIALAGVWLVAMGAFFYLRNLKVTAEKLTRYESAIDLNRLQAAERARTLRQFEDMINAMPADERRRWRTEDGWKRIYGEMTDEERGQFIEATLPSGFKQMMDSFAAMPEDQRKKVVEDAINNLRQGRPNSPSDGSGSGYGTNGPPPLSPELEQQVRQLGLKAYYGQSSAEIKVELAPLMEEIQNQIQNGGRLR